MLKSNPESKIHPLGGKMDYPENARAGFFCHCPHYFNPCSVIAPMYFRGDLCQLFRQASSASFAKLLGIASLRSQGQDRD
jgi:hypothetical protein